MIIVVPAQAIPVVAAVVLGVIIANLAFLAVASAAAEVEVQIAHDDVRVMREEGEAVRTVRVRYARGELTAEEYRQLAWELGAGQPS